MQAFDYSFLVGDAIDCRRSCAKGFKKVPIKMPMLLYLCNEMAKKGKENFFSGLKRLDFMRKVSSENRCKYFEDFATTAQKHGHNELAKAIETSRYDEILTFLLLFFCHHRQ